MIAKVQNQESKRPRDRIFLSPPHMNGKEMAYVMEAFRSNYIAPLGPMVDAFEREFCDRVGIPHAVAVSSGTAACHLALRILGVGPGDLVIASTLTFIGSVTPVLFQGATPLFVDAERSSWNMDPDLLEETLLRLDEVGRLPKAVLPTDLYGQCCDYDRIFEVCRRYGVPVVVDAAEALGAQYLTQSRKSAKGVESWIHAGSGAKAAFFSFNGNKIVTTSGGGMLVSEDADFIEKARCLSQQARDPLPHYEHSDYGYNYRMSNILAAIGRAQLVDLDERVERKREIFDYYRRELSGLPGIDFMPEAPYSRSTRWLTVILITPEAFGADREAVRLALEAENIESRPLWKPMHAQPVFQSTDFAECTDLTKKTNHERNGSYPCMAFGGAVSEDLFKRGLCLPSGTQMTEADLARVVRNIREVHHVSWHGIRGTRPGQACGRKELSHAEHAKNAKMELTTDPHRLTGQRSDLLDDGSGLP